MLCVLRLLPSSSRLWLTLGAAPQTHFSQALWEDPKQEAKIIKQVPLGRVGVVEDIAGAVCFLARSLPPLLRIFAAHCCAFAVLWRGHGVDAENGCGTPFYCRLSRFQCFDAQPLLRG